MAAICADLVTIILIHLPAKSLIRFKSVSKEWCSLISSPCFIRLHRENHQSGKRYLVAYNWTNPYCYERRVLDTNLTVTTKFCLPKPFNNKTYKYVKVVGSCHGLVVLYLYFNSYNDDGQWDVSSMFVMCNPSSTNNYMVLPAVDLSDTDQRFKIRASRYCFGYDSSTDEYKLVVFGHNDLANYHRVYSAKRNSWGPARLGETGCMDLCDQSAAVVDDHIFYWPFRFWKRENNVFLPDFGAEDDQLVNKIGNLDNKLCLESYDDVNTNVWVMKVYGVKESWTKLATLPRSVKYLEHPIAYCDNGRLLFQHSGSYFWYDLEDKFKKDTSVSSSGTRLTLCTESLVPVPPVPVTANTE